MLTYKDLSLLLGKSFSAKQVRENSTKTMATACLHLHDECGVCVMWIIAGSCCRGGRAQLCSGCSWCTAKCRAWRVRACADAGADLIKGENNFKNVWVFLMHFMGEHGEKLSCAWKMIVRLFSSFLAWFVVVLLLLNSDANLSVLVVI